MEAPDHPFEGTSTAATGFREELRRAASSRATVLLHGESGTGKAAAARRLHELGERSSGPFVAANLAALSPTLVESALFGHERGAFTDAHKARRGVFQKADGGTVVLDDVDLLPKEVQVKLLRTLQERVVEPLGGDGPLEVDVRIVATTGADLRNEVDEGRFREDLFYRLAVVTLEVPPLRARREDVEALAGVLLERVAARAGVPARPLADDAIEALRAHSWPGNVRELENVLERVLVLGRGRDADGRSIAADELDFLAEATHGVGHEVAVLALSHGLTVHEVESAMLERALEEQRGNVSAAARQVGLTRRAFDYRRARDEEGEARADSARAREEKAS